MIEDERLRNLFREEIEERIKNLEKELETLKVNFQDKEVIESAFRDAHSIRGIARILYIHPIEIIANRLEEILNAFKKETIAPNSEIIQAMYEAIYAIQALGQEAITGKTSDVNVPAILEGLSLINYKPASSTDTPPKTSLQSENEFGKEKGNSFDS